VFSNVFRFQATSRSSMRVCMCVFDLQPGPGFVCYFCAHFLFLCFYYSTILLFAISKFWSCFAFVHYFKVLQFFAISRFESKALLMCFWAKQEFCVFQLSSGSELLVKMKAFSASLWGEAYILYDSLHSLRSLSRGVSRGPPFSQGSWTFSYYFLLLTSMVKTNWATNVNAQ
jgi:hypothetical protein